MKEVEDQRVIELHLDEPLTQRRRGRPVKADALTPAERAKRYRDKRKGVSPDQGSAAARDRHEKSTVTDPLADMQGKLVKLQFKYDIERMSVVKLQTELANLRQAAQRPAVNPLAAQVKLLKNALLEKDKIIAAYSAELHRLCDELKSSRK